MSDCTTCKDNKGVQIIYGRADRSMKQRAASGKIVLGGCVMELKSPTHACVLCKRVWLDEQSPAYAERVRWIKAMTDPTDESE
jgi:hypothetical protein